MADTPNGYAGYPLQCFPVDENGNPVRQLPFNPYDSVWRRFAAQILCEQYSDPALAANRLFLALPTYTHFRVDNSASQTPGTLIAGNGLHLLVFVSGTTTALQLGTQAFQSLQPPRDFGGYETFPLWNAAAIEVANRIAATGLGVCPHVTFIGHSYGGAVAQLLAYWYSRTDSRRVVFLLTFGCPPAGQVPSRPPYPNNIVQASLLNIGDPVGVFPPPSPYLEWASLFAGPAVYSYWKRWKPPRGVTRLFGDGKRLYDDNLTITWLEMTAFIIQAVTHVPINPGADHFMPEYVRRLFLPDVPATPCGDA